jgi:GrpB-like predicted nucleotidyltransferase (UPF0157 family)
MYVSCIVLDNPHYKNDTVATQKEILHGRYEFIFPQQVVATKQKFMMTMAEPMSFYMYKRGDFKTKFNKVDKDKLKAAQRIYEVLVQVKQDLHE